MKRIYLVASEPVAIGSSVYAQGQIFLAAANDQAQGGYHARPILISDIEAEPGFEMDYSDGMPVAKDYWEEYVFLPYFPVAEFTDTEKAVVYANGLNEEAGYIS